MDIEKLIIGVLFVGLGLLFFFNNKNIAAGVANIYQKYYTENNLKIIFKAVGIVLILGGFVLIFLK